MNAKISFREFWKFLNKGTFIFFSSPEASSYLTKSKSMKWVCLYFNLLLSCTVLLVVGIKWQKKNLCFSTFFFKKCKLTKLKLLFKEEIRYQCGFFFVIFSSCKLFVGDLMACWICHPWNGQLQGCNIKKY